MHRGIAVLLGLALALNLAALFTPFVEVRLGLDRQTYSLLHSVQMLWDFDLTYLAVLVAGFSIVFPFAKLAVLSAVFLGKIPPIWASRVGTVGKWSMLDLFLVALLLGVSYDRLLIDAVPQWGLLCFALSIILSMLAGELLHPPESETEPAHHGGVAAILVGLAACGTAGSLLLPLFKTDAWFLSDVAYSIIGLTRTLWQAGAIVPAMAVGLFLVAFPVMRLLGLGLINRVGGAWTARTALLSRWSMHEPFALALAIFAIEGEGTIPTALAPGAVALLIAMAMTNGAVWALTRRRHQVPHEGE
jgi:paraquat-inducible protein A